VPPAQTAAQADKIFKSHRAVGKTRGQDLKKVF
jgi:hypothetical protein